MTTSATVLPLAKNTGESYVSVGTELAYGTNAVISLNDASVRTLAGAGGSGTVIDMNALRNKSNAYAVTPFIVTNSSSGLLNLGLSCYCYFNADGTITGNAGTEWFGGGGQARWWSATPSTTMYMRAWRDSVTGGPGGGSANNFGGMVNGGWSPWASMASNRYIRAYCDVGSYKAINGVKLQLATDAAGTDIIATSPYGFQFQSDNT